MLIYSKLHSKSLEYLYKCWPLLHMIRVGLMLSLESQRFFSKICFCFVLFCYINKNVMTCPFVNGEHWILFSSNLIEHSLRRDLYMKRTFPFMVLIIESKQRGYCLLAYCWSGYSPIKFTTICSHGRVITASAPVSRANIAPSYHACATFGNAWWTRLNPSKWISSF